MVYWAGSELKIRFNYMIKLLNSERSLVKGFGRLSFGAVEDLSTGGWVVCPALIAAKHWLIPYWNPCW